jgi:hypothetical protein
MLERSTNRLPRALVSGRCCVRVDLSPAARVAGVERKHLYRLMEKLGIRRG